MSPKQLTSFSQVLDQKLDEKLDPKLSKLKNDLEESLDKEIDKIFDEKLAFLPTKEEFFTKMDEVMGELQTIRDELTVMSHHSSQHSDDIGRLQSIHPGNSHKLAINP